jgi:EAL domain-containing protein (putative c-di-GMP-specific phosphodiesterase class I)
MVVQVGELFGLDVIAQGIERQDQRDALLSLGCTVGQGYLLGRPLPLGSPALA